MPLLQRLVLEFRETVLVASYRTGLPENAGVAK
jgi:hypothetical protein